MYRDHVADGSESIIEARRQLCALLDINLSTCVLGRTCDIDLGACGLPHAAFARGIEYPFAPATARNPKGLRRRRSHPPDVHGPRRTRKNDEAVQCNYNVSKRLTPGFVRKISLSGRNGDSS